MRRAFAVLLGGIFLSGTASLINQVAWQRGLKVFLGGSDALSSMAVVLVFMLGLGVGSGSFATRASRIRNPLRSLAIVELLLCLATAAVGFFLSRDLSESVYAMQRAAVGIGVPLRLLYVLGALVVLGVPCFLMGITLPLSSEVCQRQLKRDHARVVNVLLFVNTAGAVAGALGSGFVLLPWLGQTATIGLAAIANALAGATLFALSTRVPIAAGSGSAPDEKTAHASARSLLVPTFEDRLGLAMGFLSLGYEMYLFRAMALVHEPLPFTFAAVLCGFLAAWSVGAYFAQRLPPSRVPTAILCTAAGVAFMPFLADLDRWSAQTSLLTGTIVASLPVVGLGLVYGGLITRSATRWGSDVGRFSAWNTVGSCGGVLLGTLVGYEMAPPVLAVALVGGMIATFAHANASSRPVAYGAVAAALGFTVFGLLHPPTPSGGIVAAFYDRDGVVEIDPRGNLVWDGLWHSKLAREGNHIGTPNWLLAVAPVLVHQGPVEDALVVGVGAGITVGTLAKIGTVAKVDAYDINRGLQEILARYAAETLHVGSDPRVEILWQDGRSGLALRPKQYDLITQQPLYLKQAGSSLLLSREYFRLVKRRLRPGGVFTIYANALGVEAQSHLVRETAESVFEHCVTFDGGYLIVASDSPIVATEESFRTRIEKQDALGREMQDYETAARSDGRKSLFERLDVPAPWKPGKWVIRDDHPLVEYPGWASVLVRDADAP